MSAPTNRFRLPLGGKIERSQPLAFRFDGRSYVGFAGDTLASALLANGVRVVGRSFKYHRPRGIIGHSSEESNALVELGVGARRTPNLRATEIRLYDGLEARAVNCWPSAAHDLGEVNNLIARFLPAGFYYKTFMWPHWHLYEGAIRRAAGLGKAASAPDPDRYESRFAHCDVLIVGSGAAGLAAALSAAKDGSRVILAEQDHILGGQLCWEDAEIDGYASGSWVSAVAATLRAAPEVRILMNTTVTGYFDHNSVAMIETVAGEDPSAPPHLPRYRHWQVRAGRVVLATGAIERPLVFSGNDRPGIMLASSVRHYLARYAVRPGNEAVIVTNNDEAYRTAFAIEAAGGRVVAVVDTRNAVSEDLTSRVEAIGTPLFRGALVHATHGSKALRGVTVRRCDGGTMRLPCDLIAMSGGHNPNVSLFSQSGGTLRFNEELTAFCPLRSVQSQRSVGAAAGLRTLSETLASGHIAGVDDDIASGGPRATRQYPLPAQSASWHQEGEGKAFVDFQNDVTAADIALAAREGFVSVEHLKRYTTLGMAPDQGKTSNVNGVAILAKFTRRSIAETGTTRFRFPVVPVPLGAFAGRRHGELLRPLRRLPLHGRHTALGAIIEDFGWLRPSVYPRPGESRSDAELREARAVRTAVGIFDGSPLGKIEVRGRDAARLLDFIYANRMSTLETGRVRYGLMLDELGSIIDDGVCARLAKDHFLVGTSSAGAERIAGWLEEWLQCEFVDYDVIVAPVTTSWAVLTIAGPQARDLLAELETSFDLSPIAFPHMSCRQGTVAGIETRTMRVSYTGETSFEISVLNRHAGTLWDRLMEVGTRFGLTPFGIDALNLLRLEKGYLHIGADTDGTTTPLNIGWDHVMRRKDDFVGKRSLMRPLHNHASQLQLVGLETDGAVPLPIGAHVTGGTGAERESDGFVTSSAFSPVLGKGIALALVRGGAGRLGATIVVEHERRRLAAKIVTPVRYDPEGKRLDG